MQAACLLLKLGTEVSRSLLCESIATCICIHFPWGGWLCVWCACGWGGGCGTCVTTSSCLVPCRLAKVIDLGGRLLPRELSRAADRQQCLICILLNRFTNLRSIVPLFALLLAACGSIGSTMIEKNMMAATCAFWDVVILNDFF